MTVEQPPILDGVLTVADGRVQQVGIDSPAAVVDLGDVAILPVAINAHTHLEFGDCHRPLGQPGMGFCDWIRTVLRYRETRKAPANAIAAAVRESLNAHVGAVGEIVTVVEGTAAAYEAPLGGVQFLEIMGHSRDRLHGARERAVAFLDDPAPPGWRRGLSPHAPYTASPELLAWAATESAAREFPLAMHLAETSEEMEWLASGHGPFRELLQERGADVDAIEHYSDARGYLEHLSQASTALVVHGNYLSADDWAFLGRHRDRLHVVYCPRTHAFFQHPPYPLRSMLDAGVSVCLGTDSRASNPDLDIWKDACAVAQRHPDVSSAEILEMVTVRAAMALAGELSGTLTVGAPADFVSIPLARQTTELNLFDQLLGRPI